MATEPTLLELMGGPVLTPAERKALNRNPKKPKKTGYADVPGTGPEGETCSSCKHLHRNRMSKTYLKCSCGACHGPAARAPMFSPGRRLAGNGRSLMRDPDDEIDYLYDDTDQEDCWQCGGEGYVWDCFDGLCVNAEEGCKLCTRRCDVCNRPKKKGDAE